MSKRVFRRLLAVAVALMLFSGVIPAAAAPVTHVVFPSGDTTGVADADNIEEALAAASVGDTVVLKAGSFHLVRPVRADNFSGRLIGEGSDATVVRTVENFVDEIDGIPWMFVFGYEPASWADLTIEGIRLVSEVPAAPWGLDDQWNYLAGFIYVGDASIDADPFDDPVEVDLHVADVAMLGKQDPVFNNVTSRSTLRGLMLWNTYGQVRWTDNAVSNLQACGVVGSWLTTSDIEVRDVEATSVGTAVCLVQSRGSTAEITGLTTVDAAGVYVYQGFNSVASEFFIHGNDIEMAENSLWAGIEVWDLLADTSSSAVIRHNQIRSDGAAPWGPIFLSGTQGTVVASNTIRGNGPAAIYAGLGWNDQYVTGLNLLGNNLQQWETTEWNWLPPVAPIWLGPLTTGSTVVGNKADVVDEGQDNRIAGVNVGGTKFGQTIRDGIHQAVEAKTTTNNAMTY